MTIINLRIIVRNIGIGIVYIVIYIASRIDFRSSNKTLIINYTPLIPYNNCKPPCDLMKLIQESIALKMLMPALVSFSIHNLHDPGISPDKYNCKNVNDEKSETFRS